MASTEKRGHERTASAEFRRVDRTVQIYNATEHLRSDILNYISSRLEEFSSEIKHTADIPSMDEMIRQPIMSAMDFAGINKIDADLPLSNAQQVETKKSTSSAFPTKTFRMRASILTELLQVSHIRSIRQIFIAVLIIVVLQVAITDLFELGTIDFRFDVIRWNFSNLSACFRLWLCLFISTCIIVYNSLHFWAYKRLSFIPRVTPSEKPKSKSTSLLIFDWFWFVAYCCYIGLFLYFPVYYILTENYPIVTRIFILMEQVK